MTTQKISKSALQNALRRANNAIEELKILKGDYAIRSAEESSADFLITRENKTLVRVIKGPEGKLGRTGLHGAAGLTGSSGKKGIKGDQGVKGLQGLRGYTGNRGETGKTGGFGVGERGKDGLQGIEGKTGKDGVRGIGGKDGRRGVAGMPGEQGDRGEQGVQGIEGKEGSLGKQGEVGKEGLKGDTADGLIETRVIAGVVEFRVRSERLYRGKIRWTGWIRDLEKLLNELKSLGGGGGTSIISFQPMSAKSNGTKVGGDDINTFDFSSDFVVTESPDKEINISLAGGAGHALVSLDVNADTLLSLSTQELGLDTQVKNLIFGGPGSGADAVPTFRSLVDDDIPTLDHATKLSNVGDHTHAQIDTHLDSFNGLIIESFTFVVASNGTTITGTLDKDPSGDLTENFSDGESTFSSGGTATLTAGSAISPQKNYVYILQSNKGVLVVSTSDWPATEHIKIAEVVVQTAALVQSDGILANRHWNDHLKNDISIGHHLEAWERLRWEHAAYKSGSAVTWTITPQGAGTDDVDLAITAGKIYQMHLHGTVAFDTADPDDVYVVNQHTNQGGAYFTTNDLEDLLTDSQDVAMSGKYFSLVVWASVSSGSEEEKVFINLPSGSYVKQGDATDDVSGYDNYTIPTDFRGYAYLVNRITLRHQAASNGTWTNVKEVDLRGQVPNMVAGSGTASITTEFSDNAFKIFDEGDPTKELAFQVSGVSVSTTRTITVPDEDVSLIDDASSDPLIDGDTANDGTEGSLARKDHIHIKHHAKYTNAEAVTAAKTVKLDDFTAPDDNTDLNASTTKHGLLLKLNNDSAKYLNGQGAWATPAGGSGTFHYSITVENPNASEDISISFTQVAITITEMRAVLIGSSTPSVTWKIRHQADRNNAGNAVVTAGTTTTSTTTGSDVTAFDDATIGADSFIWFETTAKSGTVTEIHITIIGTVD